VTQMFLRFASSFAMLAAFVSAMALAPSRADASPCSSALVSAVEEGDVPAIATALDAGAAIRCSDDKGSTLLHVLVIQSIESEGDEGPEAGPIAKLLIDRGADANALDATGKTPLMLACVLQKILAVQGLLDAGADPNVAGPDSSSALEYALRGGDPDLVAALLRGGANPNQRLSGDGLPLINAVTTGAPALVELLLHAGADPYLTSAMGTSALDHARQGKNASMVALLEKPVPPEQRLKVNPAPPPAKSVEGGAASAAKAQATPAGPDPNLQAELADAISNKRYADMEKAIAKGADVIEPGLGMSPVLYATRLGDLAAIDILLKHHATLDRSDIEGDTPLIHAVVENNESLLKGLMSRGADLNYLSSKGATALMAACEVGNLKISKILLGAGANPNVKGYQGMTALFWAAKDNHTDIVKELLQHKADPNVVEEQYGATPLVMAMSSGQIESVKALVDAGADPTIVMKGPYAGMNAIDVARKSGAPDLVKMLEKAKPKTKR
jgi:ankyrin repeat protein